MKTILFLACLSSLYFPSLAKKAKYVTTSIDAKWDQTPLSMEIAEFLWDKNDDAFWAYVDALNSLEKPAPSAVGSDKAAYEAALEEASKFLSQGGRNLLKLALSLRMYSPRVEMFHQIASQHFFQCDVTVQVAGKFICSAKELEKAIEEAEVDKTPEVFQIDHRYPEGNGSAPVVILYGELGAKDFPDFHKALKNYAEEGKINYIFRPYIKHREKRRVRLSGYGVELQMKSTEYKAQDDSIMSSEGQGEFVNVAQDEEEDVEVEGFNFKVLKNLYSDLSENLDKFRNHLISSSNELTPLKVWQFQELSLQAAQRIMDSPTPEDALNAFINIAQNFPMQTKSLVNVVVSTELRRKIQNNQEKFSLNLNVQPSDTAMFINGVYYDIDIVDVITLLDSVRNELKTMEELYKIGIKSKEMMSSLLALNMKSDGGSYALDMRDSAVLWINDLETDSRYSHWSTSIRDLLKPTFPGMMRSIKRNLFNLVIICDPSNRDCWPLLKMAESFIVHTAPIRVGLIFHVPTDKTGLESAGVALLNAFNYMAEMKGKYEGLSFITEVYATIKTERHVKVNDVKSRLKAASYGVDTSDVLGSDSDYDTGRKLGAEFIAKSGLRNFPQALLNGVPLSSKVLNVDDFEEAMLIEIMKQTPVYQKAIYKGELAEGKDAFEWIMSRPSVMPRLNGRVLQESARFLDLPDSSWEFVSNIIYIGSNDEKEGKRKLKLVTFWLVIDANTNTGLDLLNVALEYADLGSDCRIGIIVTKGRKRETDLNEIFVAATKRGDDLAALVKTAKNVLEDERGKMEYDYEDVDWPSIRTYVASCELFVMKDVRFKAGEMGIIANGHVIGPLEAGEEFHPLDFSLMERHSLRSYADKVVQKASALDEATIGDASDNLIRIISSLAGRKDAGKTRLPFHGYDKEDCAVKLPAARWDEPAFDVKVVVDPVSRGAQKVGPIIAVMREVLNADVEIYLNCVERHSDMPLKSYYRFVLDPELKFDPETGALGNGPIAKFEKIATNSLLTQNMHVPENWLVESVASPYDLDNIKLQDVDSTVYSQFELEYLLVEGHCFDATFGSPPRGLQITLGTEATPVIVDTIVMANLGYFQLKANPGVWNLRLRQGRSADIYDIVSHDDVKTSPNGNVRVMISSFQSNVMKLKVNKKAGKATEELLADDTDGESGIWSSITSTFSSSKDDSAEDETVNIFSVASGHLYERFLKIMMLSVMKHTKSPVKFWFLKNYLSPSFKDFLPRMAERYGFKYELVQYKWPRWLNQQAEKQRIIWGYKILFLDVLFPLGVKKIIFADADLVVRADMKELTKLDMQGAPYAYTPFCESRKEMEGFRFWKQGYWKTHLQDRRYHISALYVVDLKRFRKIAAGDRLRGQYQALSQDPNSLSNLDQDLPNNMIHQVPIKSLPQEWLWCETWCDDASKSSAKTIDLCNNPMTKEAKLTAAMRIVEEWKDYDAEVKRLQLRMDEHAEDEFGDHTAEGGKSSNEKAPSKTEL